MKSTTYGLHDCWCKGRASMINIASFPSHTAPQQGWLVCGKNAIFASTFVPMATLDHSTLSNDFRILLNIALLAATTKKSFAKDKIEALR